MRPVWLLPIALAASGRAQQIVPAPPRPQAPSAETLALILPTGSGRILLPSDPKLSFVRLAVYDEGERPVAQFADETGINVSYLLFPNRSGTPTADGCRTAGIGPLERQLGTSLSNLRQSPSGALPATTSYLIDSVNGAKIRQQNLFAFYGGAETCLEIHISKVAYKPADDKAMVAMLATLKPDLGYRPLAKDYFLLASILFRSGDTFSAAPYYRSALAALPVNAGTLETRRVIADQLARSLGMSGKLAESRKVSEAGVAADPDYPLNYYLLACADAEAGHAAEARLHLQQAFDRRANALKAEPMPNPTKDASLLKLKKDKSFWDFVKSLPKSPAK